MESYPIDKFLKELHEKIKWVKMEIRRGFEHPFKDESMIAEMKTDLKILEYLARKVYQLKRKGVKSLTKDGYIKLVKSAFSDLHISPSEYYYKKWVPDI